MMSFNQQECGAVAVKIDGARAREAPATWGQLHILHLFSDTGDSSHHLNLCTTFVVPDGCDIDGIVNALQLVLARHEILRTTCHRESGVIRQHVAGDGELVVGIYETDEEQLRNVADGVAARLSALRFSCEREWPIRSALILSAEHRPALLVVVVSHLAMDSGAFRVFSDELSRLLAGDNTLPAAAWQPADQAHHEQSVTGRALNRRAIGYLRRVLQSAPATVFDYTPQKCVDDRAVVFELRSPAAMHASAVLAKRMHVSSSSVLLAATAVVIGILTGRTSVVMNVVTENRWREPQRSLIANLVLDSVCPVDFTGLSFDQIILHSFRASILAYVNGSYDPNDRQTEIQQEILRRGRFVRLDVAFNDSRRSADAENEESADADLYGLTKRTQVIQHSNPFFGKTCFYVRVTGSQVWFASDASFVSPGSMSEMVHGFERLLVTSTYQAVSAVDLAKVVSVREIKRGPDWMRFSDGFANLPAIGELWRSVSGSATAEVLVQDVDDSGRRLIGYVYNPLDSRSVAELHRDFVAALGERTDVRTPDWYVRCRQAPCSQTNQRTWAEMPIADEGSGRLASEIM